ncbi:MAG: hypothetical protein NXI31_03435 [bacterium]|nr:hypothetical protein [bacterium]
MLAALITATLTLSPQAPTADRLDRELVAAAVAVRGETELSPAEAYASASRAATAHMRVRWEERTQRAVELRRPFWLPELLVEHRMQRWLADLPIEQITKVVDREDKERVHEFGNSYQTTLWVAEEPRSVKHGERRLRAELKRLERTTAVKYGGIAAGWAVLAFLVGWLDRLSRGYMTGRLRLLGVLCGAAFPAVLFVG